MRTITKLVNAFVLFVAIYSCVCAAEEESIKVAVWEFENNSGRPDLEHLKKGIRDMITTDITQVNNITVVERARIDQIFKEINLSKSQYFDKENSVKIGKMIGASYLLTGSYFLDTQRIRIDVRLISVETGEIVYAEKAEGEKTDFFDLEKTLASAIILKITPRITQKEMRRVNQLQTENFAVFDMYAQAVYAKEHGNLSEAIKLLQKATAEDSSFKMGQDKLVLFQKDLTKKITEQEEKIEKKEKQKEQDLTRIMDSEFSLYKSLIENADHSSSYYLAILSVAVHHGLRNKFREERNFLIRFWKEFSQEKEAFKIWLDLQKKLEENSQRWEKLLMEVSDTGGMAFSEGAEDLYTYPRFSNIWPFCQNFSISGHVLGTSLLESKRYAIHNLQPHHFFSGHYHGDHGLDISDYSNPNPQRVWSFGNQRHDNIRPLCLGGFVTMKQLIFEVSIASFYVKYPKFKISQRDFKSMLRRILSLSETAQQYYIPNKTEGDRQDILFLLDSLSLLSSMLKGEKEKLELDKFILFLTKKITKE